MNKQNKKNIEYINFASVISAMAVVFLHANGCFWIFSGTERYWATANVIECLFYFAVPIFFMISGATLLDFFQRYSMKEYFFKRIHKTVIPYVFWSCVGLAFRVFYLKEINLEDVTLKYMIHRLVEGNAITIYWFFIPLFGIYLSIPLFAAIREELRIKVFTYLAAVCLFFNCLIPFVGLLFSFNTGNFLKIEVGSGYLLWVILGYLLSHCDIKLNTRRVLYAMGAVGFFIHLIGTYALSMSAGKVVSAYKGYNNIPCILYSIAVFIFIRYGCGNCLFKIPFLNKLINFLKEYTFSLYLVHWYILMIISRSLAIDTRSIIYRLGSPFCVLGITVVLVWLLRKIPGVKKYILP